MKRALAVLLLVAACGGGSSGSSSGSDKAAYLTKAEAICTASNSELKVAKKTLPPDIAAVPPYVHKLIDIARRDVTDLSALTPPKADAADITSKVIAPLKAQLLDGDAYAAKIDAAAAAKDNATLTDLVLHPPTKTRADVAFMKSYGFKACVKAADTGNTAG
ncbi:MAG: hypothetical protein NVSMB55_09500 [Mycobacteriales bacterium]